MANSAVSGYQRPCTATRTSPHRHQSDGLVERFHCTMDQQLAFLTAQHQRDWDNHLPLSCRTAVQESTACTPSLLMLGRELHTPAELAFGRPPDSSDSSPGPEYAKRLQNLLESAHLFALEQQQRAGMRQKRNHDLTSEGRHFQAIALVCVFNSKRTNWTVLG